jgi:hypothetical protein
MSWSGCCGPRSEKVHVGYKLIELMVLSTGLCEVKSQIRRRRQEKVLLPTEKTLEWINNRNDFLEVLAPGIFSDNNSTEDVGRR